MNNSLISILPTPHVIVATTITTTLITPLGV